MLYSRVDLPSWDDVRYFLAIARAGSANAAARELGVDHTTVSRRLKGLEGRLGTSLFIRVENHLELTPEGRIALYEAERMEKSALTLVDRLSGSDNRMAGDVRISVTEGLATYWLIPRLQPFQAAHPDIRIDLSVSNAVQDLVSEVDLAIRFVAPSAPEIIARKVASIKFFLFAAPAYAQEHGLPQTMAELRQHRLIDHTAYRKNPALRPWTALLKELPVTMRTDNAATIQAAIAAGTGMCLLPSYSPHVLPDLVRAPVELGISTDVWLVYHEKRRHITRVQITASEIARLFAESQNSWFV